MVTIKAPWLPLHLSSREEQVHSTCKSTRRVHTSNTPMVGFCVNWYFLEMQKSKGGENHVSPSTRHRDKGMHLTPMMCGWTGRSSLYLYLAGREEMGRKSRESKPRGKKIAVGNLVRYWPWKDWAGEGETWKIDWRNWEKRNGYCEGQGVDPLTQTRGLISSMQ